jgi:hypothetical protein
MAVTDLYAADVGGDEVDEDQPAEARHRILESLPCLNLYATPPFRGNTHHLADCMGGENP